jgi:hypothetical protein
VAGQVHPHAAVRSRAECKVVVEVLTVDVEAAGVGRSIVMI